MKIAVFEKTEVLKIRLEKMLSKHGFGDTIFFTDSMIEMTNIDYLLKDRELVILDYDQYQEYLEMILKKTVSTMYESKVSLIVLTSESDLPTLAKIYRMGLIEVIIKPFDDFTLINKILKLKDHVKTGLSFISNQKVENTKEVKHMLKWDSDFEIGITEIDQEHKMIIDNFEKLYNLMREGNGHSYYPELLNFLEKYVTEHFDHEEIYIAEHAKDLLDYQKKLHQNFKDQVYNLIETHQSKEVTNEDLIRINLFIKDWLVHHILIEDKKIKQK